MTQVCVVIPFRGDPSTLHWVLDGFARQDLPDGISLQVRVGCDGGPAPADRAPEKIRFHTFSCPSSGAAAVRNRLLDGVTAEVVIFANADARPVESFVKTHVARLLSLPPRTMVLGSSPYEAAERPTVFDALKEESPMIFFYDQMQPDRHYDYRHAWTLNLSTRLADFRAVGGFSEQLRPCFYEDLDFAYKLMGTEPNVFYDPAAVVTHRHPMSVDDYLDREETLGTMAPTFARINPDLFSRLFGPRTCEHIAADYRVWTAIDLPSHRWSYQRFTEWANEPQSVLPPPHSQDRRRLLMTLYQMHLPLKRFAFRLGFLRGLELTDDLHWQQRRSIGSWKQAVK